MPKSILPNILPFDSLLLMLKANGFRFGVDTRVRMGEYWQLVAGDEHLSAAEIKAHLCALLCRSAEEQERFGRIFETYVPPGLKPLGDWEERPSPPRPEPTPVKDKPAATTEPQLPQEQDVKATPSLAQPAQQTGKLGAVLPMLTFPEEPFRIWNLRGMSEALVPLQEKVLTDSTEWDVPATIRAIIESGGFPKLAFRQRRQAPRYLVLIEQQSPRDHLAGYAAELVKEINHRDLEAEFYFFDKNPARCWKVWRDSSTHVNLELLKSEWNGARLLLLSHASCFVNPATGAPSNLALDLPDHFSNVALLATNSPLEWGAAERSLLTVMPVLPMNIEGLRRLMSAWNGDAQLSFGDWQVMLPEPLPPALAGAAAQRAPAEVFMDVYRYLGKDAFRWLCACAVYPEIYFELTSILHDEAIPPLADLSEWQQHEKWNQAMRLLSRMHWYRRGYLPPALQEDLKRNLKPADLALVEGEIRRILEISKNQVDETTHAASIRQQMFDWMADQGFRVLWIDDNPENNQRFVDEWSKSLGILFRQARNTSEAGLLLEKERFHLVISDVGRKDEEKPATATLELVHRFLPPRSVIFFTNRQGMNLRATLMEAGAMEVTNSGERLREVVGEVWGRKFGVVETQPETQQQYTGTEPLPESSYQQNVDEPPLNQTAEDQEMLKKLGYYEGEIDGKMGEQLHSAIRRFQQENGMIADGILGPKTREVLRGAVERLETSSYQQQQHKQENPPENSRKEPEEYNPEAIKNLIVQGELDEALNMLADSAPKFLENELIMLKGRLAQLKKAELNGTINYSDAARERNLIVSAVLDLNDRVTKEDGWKSHSKSSMRYVFLATSYGTSSPLSQTLTEADGINTVVSSNEHWKCLLIYRASIETLIESFRKTNEFSIQVFHFVGNAIDRNLQLNEQALTIDEMEDVEKYTVGVGRLAGIIKDLHPVQLVFLNGCSTEAQAQSFKDAGIPAVIYTIVPLNDRLGILFAKQFYAAFFKNNATLGQAFDIAKAFVMALKDNFDNEGIDTHLAQIMNRGGANIDLKAESQYDLYRLEASDDFKRKGWTDWPSPSPIPPPHYAAS